MPVKSSTGTSTGTSTSTGTRTLQGECGGSLRYSERSWMDLSVLDEMASRLRAADCWDNNLGDGCRVLKEQIAMLERLTKYERWNVDAIKRPLQTWEQCRKLLLVITSSRTVTFSDIPAPINCCLQLAVLLYQWEQARRPCPADIRGMMHGAICVEWEKAVSRSASGTPCAAIVLAAGGITGRFPWEK